MAERDLIERLDDAVDAILAGRRDGLALAEPELATLLMVADDLRALPDPAFKSQLLAELVPPMEDEMTTMTAEEVTTKFPSIRPYLLVPDADAMIAFLQETLGAELLGRYPDAEGRVMHAAMRVGDSLIEMGEPAANTSRGRWRCTSISTTSKARTTARSPPARRRRSRSPTRRMAIAKEA